MSNAPILFRFRIALSDVDRGVYEDLDLRTAKHPSESMDYLLSRIIAYCLNYTDRDQGLEFTAAGLSDPDGPALQVKEPNGNVTLWIEIGNPSPRKLHRASKAVGNVKVYTYKDPRLLLREFAKETIHDLDKIEIVAINAKFLAALATDLPRDVRWQVLHHEGVLTVSAADKSEQVDLLRVRTGTA